MSVWYLSDKDKSAVIVELDFDCNVQEIAESNRIALEEFPLSLIKNVNDLYSSLQREVRRSCYLKNEDRVCLRIERRVLRMRAIAGSRQS
jgi:hypothetical protein